MSILIKGMETPQEGKWKTVCIYSDGTCEVPNWQGDCTLIEGAKAVEVPPHGDLIDRDALWVEVNKICDRHDEGEITDLGCIRQLLSALRHAPTIIETE